MRQLDTTITNWSCEAASLVCIYYPISPDIAGMYAVVGQNFYPLSPVVCQLRRQLVNSRIFLSMP